MLHESFLLFICVEGLLLLILSHKSFDDSLGCDETLCEEVSPLAGGLLQVFD